MGNLRREIISRLITVKDSDMKINYIRAKINNVLEKFKYMLIHHSISPRPN